MLKLKNYSFSGIGRFVQKQHIDLETRDNLIQIDGENTNTGGSSGAGKSTTVEALAYLLGISDVPSTQLQSRITKSPIWVQGEFEGDIIITRSKKDGLTIETPEGTVSGNSKLAEERLDEIIGVNRKLLKTMCYKRQKQGGFFLNLTPKESHEFLVDCLDLNELKKKADELTLNLKDKYKPRKIELESAVNILKENIQQFETLLNEKKPPVKPIFEDVDLIRSQISVMNQQLIGEDSKYKENIGLIGTKPIEPALPVFEKENQLILADKSISNLKKVMHDNIKLKETDIEQASSAISMIDSKIRDCQNAKNEMIRLKTQYEEMVVKRDHFRAGNCPTCFREWEIEKDSLEKLENKIKDNIEATELHKVELEKAPHYNILREKAQGLLEAKRSQVINAEEEKQLLSIEEERRLLKNEKQNIGNVVRQKYLEEFGEWNQKAQFIESEYKRKKNDITAQIQLENSKVERIAIQKKSYEDAEITYKTDIDNITGKYEESSNRLKTISNELLETEKNIILSEESIRLIKNFTLQKFQDTLEYIGQRATEIINQIPNMANAIIFFENAKETKSGNIKNEVNAVINLEGDVEVPIKTLSGGERTSADFAIDLAVGEMIESMTKKGVNFLIIDEGFDGLDSISKIECLEILKTLNTDKKILMVDHSSEVKEMVCDIIKVKRINEESFVQ